MQRSVHSEAHVEQLHEWMVSQEGKEAWLAERPGRCPETWFLAASAIRTDATGLSHEALRAVKGVGPEVLPCVGAGVSNPAILKRAGRRPVVGGGWRELALTLAILGHGTVPVRCRATGTLGWYRGL